MARRKARTLGNCYAVAAEVIFFGHRGLLCHGTVWHPAVGWHGHAWVESTTEDSRVEMCHDYSNGQSTIALKSDYYRAGRIKDVTRYTREEVIERMTRGDDYGPWTTAPDQDGGQVGGKA